MDSDGMVALTQAAATRYSDVMKGSALCEQYSAVLTVARELNVATNLISMKPGWSGCATPAPARPGAAGTSANRPDWTGVGLAYLATAATAKNATKTANTAPIEVAPTSSANQRSGEPSAAEIAAASRPAIIGPRQRAENTDPSVAKANAARESADGIELTSLKSRIAGFLKSQWDWVKDNVSRPLARSLLQGVTGGAAIAEGNPIAHMKAIGDGFMHAASMAWIAQVGIKTLVDAGAAGAQAASNQPLAGAFLVPLAMLFAGASSFIGSVGSLLMSLLPFLMLMGAMLAVYLPLLPFFLWVVAIIGWLITAVEAVIASPIMSILHLSPEGDGIATQRVEGWYILAMSLLLRPVLLTFGFFFSIAILEVAGGFAQAGFNSIASRMIDEHDTLLTFFSMTIGLLAAYIGMMIMIIYKSFEVIQVVPDRVFRLIGASEPGSGRDDHASQPFSQAMQPIASAGAGALAAGRAGGGGGGGGGGGKKNPGVPATAAENKSAGSASMSSGFSGAGTAVTPTAASSSRYTPGQAAPK